MILINYYKVNKQSEVHTTALTPDNSHLNKITNARNLKMSLN